MTTYIMIDATSYETDSDEGVEVAKAALAEAGLESANVWTSPASMEWIAENGDPDGYKNGQVLWAAKQLPDRETCLAAAREADLHGDSEGAAIYRRAADGDEEALTEAAAMLADVRAQEDHG